MRKPIQGKRRGYSQQDYSCKYQVATAFVNESSPEWREDKDWLGRFFCSIGLNGLWSRDRARCLQTGFSHLEPIDSISRHRLHTRFHCRIGVSPVPFLVHLEPIDSISRHRLPTRVDRKPEARNGQAGRLSYGGVQSEMLENNARPQTRWAPSNVG